MIAPLLLQGHTLELSWLTPPGWKDYQSGPLNFISHLLGHEGEVGAGAGGWESNLVSIWSFLMGWNAA